MKKYINADNVTKLFHFMVIGLFFLLFYYGLGVTGAEADLRGPDYIILQRDSVIVNIGKLAIASVVFLLIGKFYDRFFSKWNPNIFLGIACVISFLFSVCWINSVPCAPQADQGLVCQYAVAFNQGDFSGLKAGTYVTRYPQQLGLLTFLRGLFYLFGEMNYRAFQYCSALLVPLIVLSGCMILRKITNCNRRAEMYYLLFVLSCFPIYGYVLFVYGDLPSTATGLLATWLFLACIEKFSVPKVIALGLVCGITVQLRMNTVILLIAFGIVVIVKLFEKFRWQVLVTGISVLAGVLLLQGSLRLLYHDEWDDTAEGIPALLYIVMGFNDDYGQAGWHNNYEYIVFAESGDNVETSMERAKEDFQSYMGLFKNDPEYAVDFFYRKMNAQWNAPMYQSRGMNNYFDGEMNRLASTIYNDGRLGVLLQKYMKVYQLAMYGSIFWLLLTLRKKKIAIEKYVLLIAVFGGFLFSLMWEAKTRYVFPYFVMLIPYYAVAVEQLVSRMGKKKVTKKES